MGSLKNILITKSLIHFTGQREGSKLSFRFFYFSPFSKFGWGELRMIFKKLREIVGILKSQCIGNLRHVRPALAK